MNVNVGVFNPCTESMGPGKRACLWVRGCSINCPGCGTPEFIPSAPSSLPPLTPPSGRGEDIRYVFDADEIVMWIREAREKYNIEGVSFSGGEPFEQAEALACIARACRELGLSTLSWSGYTRKHLESLHTPKGARSFLDELDILIDGPFVRRGARSGLPLRGSSNQVIHLLSDRYTRADFETSHVSITQTKDGIQFVGVTNYEEAEAILSLLAL